MVQLVARQKSKGVEGFEALYERLESYLSRKGLRSTSQRRAIAQAFFEGPTHVSIEELLSAVRKDDPRIGYATVYRTLKLFAECGIAQERKFVDCPSRYELSDEGTGHHHDHLICTECGKIIEFHNEQIETLQDEVARKLGFKPLRHRHEIYGHCRQCVGKTA